MAWKTLDDMDLNGKSVLVRVDINVPVEAGRVTDATRIERIVPTVADILKMGGKPILLAHFGRPKGKVVPEMSLRQLVPALEKALGRKLRFAEDCIGLPAKRAAAEQAEGEVLLLENTRFHAEEEKNDPAFAAALAAIGDVYVNDAFSAAHRAHASTEGIARLLPAAAGRLMQAELKALEAALGDPKRPVVAVVGGAKVSTKLELLGNLVTKVNHLAIGGGMANTFLVAKGVEVGKSLAEREMSETARDILEKAEAAGCTVHLPVDVVVAREFRAGAASETVAVADCPADAMILDAGPQTVAALGKVSRSRPSTRPPSRRRARRPNSPKPAASSASPAAATRSRRSTPPAWPRGSAMSPPPAAPSSNGWKARFFPASRRSAEARREPG